MKTAADIQYEPEVTKIFQFNSSITFMTSGDSAFQAEILSGLFKKVNAKNETNPDELVGIEDVAYLYAETRNEIRAKRAENSILLPLGLSQETFLSRQHEMSEALIGFLIRELLNFDVPEVATIISGIDSTGPHIFMVRNDVITCWDTIGFVSIGIGERHANSQLMLAGLTRDTPIPEAMFLTYIAKKRSEVSPGVGEETDMFLMGTMPGTFSLFSEDQIGKLEKEYKWLSDGENQVFNTAKGEITKYVDQIVEDARKEQQGSSKNDV